MCGDADDPPAVLPVSALLAASTGAAVPVGTKQVRELLPLRPPSSGRARSMGEQGRLEAAAKAGGECI